MSNQLPIKPQRDTAALRRIKTVDDLRQWLITDTITMEKYFRLLKDTIDNFGMGTADWDIRQATADDVTQGDATVKDNLIIISKRTGRKAEYEH